MRGLLVLTLIAVARTTSASTFWTPITTSHRTPPLEYYTTRTIPGYYYLGQRTSSFDALPQHEHHVPPAQLDYNPPRYASTWTVRQPPPPFPPVSHGSQGYPLTQSDYQSSSTRYGLTPTARQPPPPWPPASVGHQDFHGQSDFQSSSHHGPTARQPPPLFPPASHGQQQDFRGQSEYQSSTRYGVTTRQPPPPWPPREGMSEEGSQGSQGPLRRVLVSTPDYFSDTRTAWAAPAPTTAPGRIPIPPIDTDSRGRWIDPNSHQSWVEQHDQLLRGHDRLVDQHNQAVEDTFGHDNQDPEAPEVAYHEGMGEVELREHPMPDENFPSSVNNFASAPRKNPEQITGRTSEEFFDPQIFVRPRPNALPGSATSKPGQKDPEFDPMIFGHPSSDIPVSRSKKSEKSDPHHRKYKGMTRWSFEERKPSQNSDSEGRYPNTNRVLTRSIKSDLSSDESRSYIHSQQLIQGGQGDITIDRSGKIMKESYSDSNPNYSYEYSVEAPHTNDYKIVRESRKGKVTIGAYSFVQPDGCTRVVRYRSGPTDGYKAKVEYRGPGCAQRYYPLGRDD